LRPGGLLDDRDEREREREHNSPAHYAAFVFPPIAPEPARVTYRQFGQVCTTPNCCCFASCVSIKFSAYDAFAPFFTIASRASLGSGDGLAVISVWHCGHFIGFSFALFELLEFVDELLDCFGCPLKEPRGIIIVTFERSAELRYRARSSPIN